MSARSVVRRSSRVVAVGTLVLASAACGSGASPGTSSNGALYDAIAAGDSSRVSDLLAKGANPNSNIVRSGALERASHRRSRLAPPIVVAIEAKRAGVVSALIGGGARVAFVDDDGFSPLEHATSGGDADVVRALLDHGAVATQHSKFGFPLLFAAVGENHPDLLPPLVAHGAPVDMRDSAGLAAAHFVGSLESVYDRLRGRSGTQARSGNTPMLLAAQLRLPLVVGSLLARGAAVDARDAEGRSALMVAVESALGSGSVAPATEVVRLLLAHGADPAAHDAHGESALDRARTLAGIDPSIAPIARLLESSGHTR